MALFDDLLTRVNQRVEQQGASSMTPSALPVDESFSQAVAALEPDQDQEQIKQQIRAEISANMRPKAAPEEVSLGDWGNVTAAAVGTLGGLAAGVGEYAGRQLRGAGETPLEQLGTDIAAGSADLRRKSFAWGNEIFSRASPEAQERVRREVLTLDPTLTAWQGGPGEVISTLGLKIANSLATTFVPLLGYGLLARMGMGGVASSLYGASEGALSMGGVAAQTAQEIEQAPIDTLLESQKFKEIYARNGGNEQKSRQEFIQEAQGAVPLLAGLAVGATTKMFGSNLDELFGTAGGAGFLRRVGVGYGTEFGQEFTQSGAEQLAQNVARQVYDKGIDLMDGVAEQAVQGGLIGGPLGGAMAGMFGQRPQSGITNSPVAPDVAVAARTPVSTPPAPMTPFSASPIQQGLPGIETEPRPAEQTNPYMGAPPPEEAIPTDPRAAQYGTASPGLLQDEAGQMNMFDPQQPTPFAQMPRPQLALPFENPVGAQRPGEGFQMAGQAPGQLSLGLRDRSTGLEPGQLIEPQPMPQEVEPEVNSLLTPSPFQEDAFPTEQKQEGFFAPTAEPVRDIVAQMEDLQNPESTRKAVYLSKQNLDNIQKLGQIDMLTKTGVPIRNFDGQGGVLIARDEETAHELSDLRGAGSLEEVIGLATGAGSQKPLGSNMVVQKLDKAGNVIRERVVTPQERMQVMKEFGEGARTLSVPAVMKRRNDLIKQERAEQAQQKEVAETFPTAKARAQKEFEGPLTEDAVEDVGELASEPGLDEEIGGRLLQYAADTRRSERAKRKSMPDVPTPDELRFRGKEITDIEREKKAIQEEIGGLEEEYETGSMPTGRRKKLTPEQTERLKEVDRRLENARLSLHKATGKGTADRVGGGVAAETYSRLYSDMLDASIAAEMAAETGTEQTAFEARTKLHEMEKKLQDFIRAEGGYTRSEALVAAATRFAPKAKKQALRMRPRKQEGSEVEKAQEQVIADRNVELAEDIPEGGGRADRAIRSFEKSLQLATQEAEVSTKTAAGKYEPKKLTPRAQELVEKLFNYLSPTAAKNLTGADSYAAVEIGGLLRQWISAYRAALRDNMPAGSTMKKRNWKMDVAAARLTEMLSRLRSDVSSNKVLADASRHVAQEIYFMIRMAGRLGVQAETNPLDFWKSVRKGPQAFRDYLRKQVGTAEPEPFLDVSEDELKQMAPEDLNSLYVRAVETSTRERSSDGRRAEMVREILAAHGERFSNNPEEIESGRRVSARSLFREHINQLDNKQLEELFLKGSEFTVRKKGRGYTEKLPPAGDKLPAPMPMNLIARRLSSSEKVKYIMRAVVRNEAQRHGGASKSLNFTRRATSLEPGKETVRRERSKAGRYNTDVLTKDFLPRDMTAEQKELHATRMEESRDELNNATYKARVMLSKLSRGEYQAAAEEMANGQLTVAAKDMIYGRAYYRWLYGYAKSLLRANLQGREGLGEMHKVANDLLRAEKLSPRKFVEEMSARVRAEFREQLIVTAAADREVLGPLRDPAFRKEDTARQHDDIRKALVIAHRFDADLPLDKETGTNQSWVQNERFQQNIAPILRKISDSWLSDGWPSYEPSQQEKDVVNSQLATWRKYKATREKFYRPLQQMLDKVGFFDRDTALMRQYKEKYGEMAEFAHLPVSKLVVREKSDKYVKFPTDPRLEGVPEEEFGDDASADYHRLQVGTVPVAYSSGATPDEQMAKRRALKAKGMLPERIKRITTAQHINESVQKFKDLVAKSDARVQDIIDAEQHLIGELTKLGAWKIVGGEKMQLGTIGLPTRAGDLQVLEAGLDALRKKQRDLKLAYGREPTMLKRLMDEGGEEAVPHVSGQFAKKSAELGEEVSDLTRRIRNIREEVSAFHIPKRMNYRRVGRRLREGEMTKAEAKRAVETQLKQFKVPDIKLGNQSAQMFSFKPRYEGPLEVGEPEAAKAMTKLILEKESGTTYGVMVETLRNTLPASHPYQPILATLARLEGHNDTEIVAIHEWHDLTKAPATVEMGGQAPYVAFDEEILQKMGVAPARAIYTMVHELVHVGTLGKLGESEELRGAWDTLRLETYRLLRNHPRLEYFDYGEKNLAEFVAEVFSNRELQKAMAETPIPVNSTLWDKFVDLVRQLLGMAPKFRNLLDAAISLEGQTFTESRFNPTTGKGLKGTLGNDMRASMELFDPATRAQVQPYLDKVAEHSQFAREIKERTTMGGSNFVLSALTMRQIDKLYFKQFGGDNGPLRKYIQSFFARNSDSSGMLEEADVLSREWTRLEEEDSKSAAELSKLMRDATMLRIHPDQEFGVEGNAHLEAEQHDDWEQLSSEWNALPAQAKELYHKLRGYYDGATARETKLLLLNAIRASKWGEDISITEDEINFDQDTVTEWIEKKVGFDPTAERRRVTDEENRVEDAAEKGDLKGPELRKARARIQRMDEELNDSVDEVALLSRMARLPQQVQGPYFPLMRFGDYAVRASKIVDTKQFKTARERSQYMRERRLDDPTVQFSYPEGQGFGLNELDETFVLAETVSEAQARRKELVAEYGEASVSPVQLKQQAIKSDPAIGSNRALQSILGKLEGNAAAQAAVREFYLNSLHDSSFRKREIKRKNIKGVDAGAQHRTFAAYAKSSSYYTAQLRHGHVMAEAKGEMARTAKDHKDESEISALRMGQVIREIETRDAQAADLQEVRPGVRKAVELGQLMLLFTPSYWMVNASQPYMITLPWLAGHVPVAEAMGALKNAQSLIISPLLKQAGKSWGGMRAFANKIVAEESFSVLEKVVEQIRTSGRPDAERIIEMLEDLKRESIIDLSFIAELRDIAAGEGKSAWDRTMDATRVMAHLTEVNNRIMTAIAAYEIATQPAPGRRLPLDHKNAVDFAKRAVAETQFDYSASNKPRLFSANDAWWKPLVFQFMQFVQHSYFLMITNAKTALKDANPEERRRAIRTLAGMLMTHAAMGGLVGATIQPIKWAIGLLMMLFGLGDDEDRTVKNVLAGETYDRMIASVTAELLGDNKFSEMLRAGLPRGAGLDLSSRLELGRLYMVDLDPKTAETLFGSMLMSFAGPLTGIAGNAYEGLQLASEGQIVKGAEKFMPKIGRDAMRTFRFANEGMTDFSGKVIKDAKDMSPLSLFAQSMGFQPSEIAETYALAGAVQDAKFYKDEQRATLMRRYNRASDADDLKDVMEDVIEFNRKYPREGITVSQMLQSKKRWRDASLGKQRFGADLSRKEQYLADEEESYNED